MRVLIVEDEALLAMSYKMSLEQGECIVTGIAANAEDAYAMARDERPEVVLMDISLSGNTDGIEAARVIMKDFKVPVIFITGNTDEQTRNRAMEIKPCGYLEKPVDCERLHRVLCINKSLDV